MLNPALLAAARRVVQVQTVKSAVVPPGDPGAGGPPGGPPMPPGDPGMGGGMPPPGMDMGAGGPPPGGPAMPLDPGMGGGGPPMPPPPPGMDMGGMPPPPMPDIGAQVGQAVQQALAESGLKGNVGPGGKTTAPKPDINTIATDVFQLKKMLLHMFRLQGWSLPQDILDGPNRDPMTGAAAASPGGGSDVQPGASAMPGGGESAIPPIGPMAPAFGPGGMGGGLGGPLPGKAASAGLFVGPIGEADCDGAAVLSKAAAMATRCRRRREYAQEAQATGLRF